MEIVVSPALLASAMAVAGSVVKGRNSGVSGHALLAEPVNDGLFITGSCAPTSLVCMVECECRGSLGKTLLPLKRLPAILREVKAEQITISATKGKLVIKADGSKFTLAIDDPEEFPDTVGGAMTEAWELDAAVLKRLVSRTVFSVDTESTRYALGGICLVWDSGKLLAVSTDTRRLSVASAAVAELAPLPETCPSNILVPAAALRAFTMALDDEATVRISVGERQVMFASGGTTLVTLMYEGRFPRWRDVIPQRSSVKMTIDAGAMASALRQAQIVISEESRGVTARVSGGEMSFSSGSSDIGDADIRFSVGQTDDEVVFTVDPKYVLDYLATIELGVPVELEYTDEDTAIVFKDGDSSTYVVMPLAR